MSDARGLIAETVERLFGDALTPEDIARAEAGQWLAPLWQSVEDAGLTRALLRPENGGADGDWLDVFEIARAVGRHSVPLPIVETILATWLLERAGLGIPEGPLGLLPTAVDGRVGERADRVPWGRSASHLVGIATKDGEARVLCVDAAKLDVREGQNVALEPRDDVVLTDALVTGEPPLARETVRLYGALLRSVQMAGALERILDQSVGYAGERTQFGKTIGSFQVIQQDLARLAGQVAEVSMAAEVACRAACESRETPSTIGATGDPAFEIACAKIVAGDAAELGPRIAHQVHGAIGFTYEHTLHFSTRRLWAWRAEFGSGEEWARDLGTIAQRESDGIWALVTSR